jgi:hypothetical protein
MDCVRYFAKMRPNSQEIAHPVSEVGQSGHTKLESATTKDGVTPSLNKMARQVRSGNGPLDYAPDSERYGRRSPLSRRPGEHITGFSG